MKFSTFLPDMRAYQQPSPSPDMSASKPWRKLFARTHRHSSSTSSTTSSNVSHGSVGQAPSLTYASTCGSSSRAPTPELIPEDDCSVYDTLPASPISESAGPVLLVAPPKIPTRSPNRPSRLTLGSLADLQLRAGSQQDVRMPFSPATTVNSADSLYPGPLNLSSNRGIENRVRPRTSGASPTTSTNSDWSNCFTSTHPALSPLGMRANRPASIFSSRAFEPDTEPDFIYIHEEDELILTLTSKYPTGAAAELYVPIDLSVPTKSMFSGMRRGTKSRNAFAPALPTAGRTMV